MQDSSLLSHLSDIIYNCITSGVAVVTLVYTINQATIVFCALIFYNFILSP